MCNVLLKLYYAMVGVSNLFFSKVIKENFFFGGGGGGRLDPLVKEGSSHEKEDNRLEKFYFVMCLVRHSQRMELNGETTMYCSRFLRHPV